MLSFASGKIFFCPLKHLSILVFSSSSPLEKTDVMPLFLFAHSSASDIRKQNRSQKMDTTRLSLFPYLAFQTVLKSRWKVWRWEEEGFFFLQGIFIFLTSRKKWKNLEDDAQYLKMTKKSHLILYFKNHKKPSDISFVPYARPQFQSYGVETLHAASTHEDAEFRSFEAGLRGLWGRQLICAIWGVKNS